MLVGRAAHARRPSRTPLVSAAFFWKLLSLEGFHPLLDACARCGDEPRRRSPPFDLDEGGVLCDDVRAARRPAARSRHPRAGRRDPRRRAAGGAAEPPGRGAPPTSSGSPSPRSSTTSNAACAAPRCSSRRRRRGANASTAFGRRKGPPTTIAAPYGQARPDGPRRQPREAARPRVPVERDLRRLPLHLGLRPARRAAQAQRQGRVVALDGAAARRHRRPRRRDPHGAARCGRRAATSRRFTDPLVDCRNCKERFRADQLPDVGRVPELRRQGLVHRGAPVQPHVQDLRRPGRGRRRRSRTCAPRPRRASSSTSRTCRRPRARSRRSASRRSASRSATRSRPGNFIFRTREFEQMEMEYFVPARGRRAAGTSTGARSASAGTPTSASPRSSCACARTTPRSCRTTRPARPTSSSCTRGGGASSRASPTAPTSTSRSTRSSRAQDLSYYDQEHDRRYLPHVIEPALGADRATLAFLLAAYDEEDVPNDKGGTEKRTVLRLHPRLAPIKVGGAAAVEERAARAGGRRGRGAAAPAPMIDVDVPDRSAAATVARTRSARRCASPSTSTPSTTRRSRSVTATRWTQDRVPDRRPARRARAAGTGVSDDD